MADNSLKWGLLFRNPTGLVELPKVLHKERRVLSPDEAVSFLKAADEMPSGLVFEFALVTGMRPEEYLAINGRTIDSERGTAIVRRALVRHKGNWSFEEPKTPRSRRTMFLPMPLIEKLKTHKRKQAERRLQAGASWQAFDLVFCSETGPPFLFLI